MKDEIKEILEFKENADYKKLSVDEIVILEDYITNLQKENERLNIQIEIALEYMNNYIKVEDATINERIKIEFKEVIKKLGGDEE